MFNKKRLCCCDEVDNVGPYYVECFPVIPFSSGELPLSGTYSFWTRIEQFVADPDENGTIEDTQVLFSTLNGSAKNTNKTSGNFTFADLKSGGATDGPVWTLYTGWVGQEAGISGPGQRIRRVNSDFSRCLSLGLRGWYMKSSSRVIRQNGFDSLSENRLYHSFPIPDPTFGKNKFSVGADFLFQSGFENFSQQFGNLTWKTDPQLVANYPEELRGPGVLPAGTLFVDTTDRFPSTVTIPVSGTAKFLAVDTASFPFDLFDIDVPISGNVVFDKTISSAGLIKYQYNQSASSQSFGQATKDYTPGSGNTFPIRLTVTRVNLPSFDIPGDFGLFDDFIFCFTSNDITDNIDANRSACGNCDQQDGGFALDPDCSPGFFPGSSLQNLNSVILGGFQRGTNEPTIPANILAGGSQPGFAGLPRQDVLGARITWGPATSSGAYTVSVSSAAGGNSWGASLPTSVCTPFGGPPFGPQLVDFHHGTFDIPLEPFPPGSTVDVTKSISGSRAILLV